MTMQVRPLPSASDVPGEKAQYPCSEDGICVWWWCSTILNHYNMGVLCSSCRRQVTENLYLADNKEEAQYYKKLLKQKRRRNRRFVDSPSVHPGLSEGTSVSFGSARGHFPQEGHW